MITDKNRQINVVLFFTFFGLFTMTSFSFADDDDAFAALSISAGGRLPTSTRSGISALSGESEFRTAQSTASTVTGGIASAAPSLEFRCCLLIILS